MRFIKLIEQPFITDNDSLKEVYTAKLHSLQHTLLFFEKIQVDATITLRANVQGNRLHTATEVICDDPGFLRAIEEAVKKYNTTSVPSGV